MNEYGVFTLGIPKIVNHMGGKEGFSYQRNISVDIK